MKRAFWITIALSHVLVFFTGAVLYATYEREVTAVSTWARVSGPLDVLSAADGDTIHIADRLGKRWTVRLRGPNTPETKSVRGRGGAECYGPEAAAETKRLIEEYPIARIRFESGKRMTDDYRRLVAYVHLYGGSISQILHWGGIDLNLHLIRQGFAEHWAYEGRYSRYDEFEAAEKAAREENLGGWKTCGAAFKKHHGRRKAA